MFAHRFRDHIQNPQPALAGIGVNCAFVACPMFQMFSATQQVQIQEIYRIAAEKTREQLRVRRRRSRLPQFSQN